MSNIELAKKILEITRHGYYEDQVAKIAALLDDVCSSTAKPNVSGELQLIEALEQYIDVLVQELNEVVVMAAVHGWRSSRFETGEQLRNKITELKSALTANNQK